MSNEFKHLQDAWAAEKKEIKLPKEDTQRYQKDNSRFYYGTLLILTSTLAVISSFFYFVAPVKMTWSRIGVAGMIGGLVIRIIAEIISIQKAKKIQDFDPAAKTLQNWMDFHLFRSKIHRYIAPFVVLIYTVGFYLITPEFALYIPFWPLVLMDVSYVVIAIVLFIIIRKAVQKEMRQLEKVIALQEQLLE